VAVLAVAGAALLGLITGRYVREFSGRFGLPPESAAEHDGTPTDQDAADTRAVSADARDPDLRAEARDPDLRVESRDSGAGADLRDLGIPANARENVRTDGRENVRTDGRENVRTSGREEGARGGRGSAERGSASIAGTRGSEARAAFRAASRTVPVPVWPPTVEAATAAVCAFVVWRLADVSGWTLAAWLYLAVVGMALTVIDWRTRRLPDALTLPSYLVLLGLLVPSGAVAQAIYGMLALGAIYAVLWFVRPDALGLGDVKLAGLIGLATGALGLHPWVVAAIGGHLLGALYALGLLVTRRGTLKSEFPFGPFMLAAALAALLATH
jgi:leader peptidase (prepilin peptidase)/N-methyltransferase